MDKKGEGRREKALDDLRVRCEAFSLRELQLLFIRGATEP
jgi:hypothetical protein